MCNWGTEATWKGPPQEPGNIGNDIVPLAFKLGNQQLMNENRDVQIPFEETELQKNNAVT